MTYRVIALLVLGLFIGAANAAEKRAPSMPDRLVVAQRTFFDFGPPNDFYELIAITRAHDGLNVERLMVTPEGQACVQPAKVESRTGTLHISMEEFLHGKNPCAIPEKDLHRELKRCKHCQAFSGINVTMLASCSGKDREIRMDILDRDLFDSRVTTPENTSWTMQILSEIDQATGPGAMDQPMFALGADTSSAFLPQTDLFHALQNGRYMALFQNDATLIEALLDAEETPPLPPSIKLAEATPFIPVDAEMPKIYPPIGRLVRVEGVVTMQADIDAQGKVSIKSVEGPEMLRDAATKAVAKWTFPEAAFGHSEEIKMLFKLNCAPHVHTNVN